MTDPRRLRPGEVCRLLNSTPMGEVLTPDRLRGHRTRAGMRIGDDRHVDLVRYTAWLAHRRHAPATAPSGPPAPTPLTAEAAAGAAAVVARRPADLTARQEAAIAALLTEPSYARAAGQAGVSPSTLYRWLADPAFRAAYRRARRELVESAIGRLQSASGEAVDTLLAVARTGRRDGDRVRASVALLDHALQGLSDADTLHGGPAPDDPAAINTEQVVEQLSERLRQLGRAELPTAEKARLTASLAETYLRAVAVVELEKQVEALQAVVQSRKEQGT